MPCKLLSHERYLGEDECDVGYKHDEIIDFLDCANASWNDFSESGDCSVAQL